MHQDNIHAGLISGLAASARYGLRVDGEYNPDQGLFFDPMKLLVDPYADWLDRTFVRSPRLRLDRSEAVDTAALIPKAIVVAGSGEGIMPRKKAPGMFYEMNVRGYTMRHPGVQGSIPCN